MATLLAAANINFTGNWLVGDATSLNDSEAANTALTTSYQNSTAFTPGAITVDGIAIKIASRAAGSPSNTISVRLAVGGVDVAGAVVTMNVSDIDECTSALGNGGWYYFRFNAAGTPTPVLLLAATAYTVGIKLSATTTAVNCYSSATTNWTRNVVTTTTAAPAAADRLMICGDNLSAGVSNSYTVTMNNTATTSFGTISTQSITVNKGGTLNWGTAASTNYYLKCKGIFQVNSGGIVFVATSGTQMPSTSTAVIEWDCTGNVDSGLRIMNGGFFEAWGLEKTHFALLNTDEAAGQTTLGVDTTAGWGSTDVVCIASTSTTASQHEKRTMNAVTASTITVTSGLTNAHSGTSPTQGEVGNLTRNIKIRGISASLNGFIYAQPKSLVSLWACEITNMGSFTTDKRGIDIQTTTGTFAMSYCAIYDNTSTGAMGANVTGSTSGNVTIRANVFYNNSGGSIAIASTTGAFNTIEDNLIIASGATAGNAGIQFADIVGFVTNNRVASTSSNSGITMSQFGGVLNIFAGNITHSNGGSGVSISGSLSGGEMQTHTSWRNASYGIAIGTSAEIIISDPIIFGNTSGGLSTSGGSFEVANGVFNAGVTNTQPVGIDVTGSSPRIILNSCTFGATTTHATGDIRISQDGYLAYIAMNNCLLSSTTEIVNQTNMSPTSFIGSEKHDQTSGNNKTWRRYGTISTDTTIFDVTPAMRMTPNNADFKLESRPFYCAATSGSAITVSVKVRESVSGDGTDYNGNRIRLIVKKNYSLGITADTVLATATASSEGAFEVISGTTASPSENGVLEFYVDCDGTTGWVNIDTFTFTPTADSLGVKYWKDGHPVVYGNNSAASSGGAFAFMGG